MKLNCVYECNSCKYKDLDYSETLIRKTNFLKNKLADYKDYITGIEFASENEIINYRKKVVLTCGFSENEWKIGLYSNKNIVEIPDCKIQNTIVNKAVNLVKASLPSYSEFPLKYYVQNNEAVCLVVKSKFKKIPEKIYNLEIQLQNIGIKTLTVHFFESSGKKIFGKGKDENIFGNKIITDNFQNHYSSKTFSQLIPTLYQKSLKICSNFFGFSENKFIVDLYSGTGLSLKEWEKSEAKAIGIESGIESVECAKMNLCKSEIFIGTCKNRIPQINKWLNDYNTSEFYVYANPPRTGLENEICDWILEKEPQKIVYLSCSAGTLKKDLDKLSGKYAISEIRPFDFFPFTHHVETLALLQFSGK